MLRLALIPSYFREHLVDPDFKVLPDVLNRVKIRGVRRPIRDCSNALGGKPVLYSLGSVNRSIILHKDIPFVQILKDRSYFCVTNLKVGPSGVPMLRRLKIPVHDIAIRPPSVPKGTLDHNLHILIRPVSLHLVLVPLLGRYTEHLLRSFPPPALHRTLVTPAN